MHPHILPLHAAIESEHWWFVGRRQIVGEVLDRLHSAEKEDAVVLDLGSGTGGTVGYLGRRYRTVGIEVDAAAVEFATEQHPHCKFVCASVFEPARWELSGEVDVCLLMDVLEHLEDDEAAVANAARAIRPGGLLLVTVPADPRLWSRHDRHHGHYRRYTRTHLERVLDREDLQPVFLTHFNSRLYPIVRLSRWLQNAVPLLGDRGTTGDLSMPPRYINALLRLVFAGESDRICSALEKGQAGYRRGVSLLAVYKRMSNP